MAYFSGNQRRRCCFSRRVLGEVEVCGYSDAKIAWPLIRRGKWRVPIVFRAMAASRAKAEALWMPDALLIDRCTDVRNKIGVRALLQNKWPSISSRVVIRIGVWNAEVRLGHREASSSARSFSKSGRLTGLTRWPSQPASRDWSLSPSCPQPVSAMMTTDRPHGCSRTRRAAS